MWMVEVPLTVGQEVKYKFVLLTEDGRMLRQCEEVQREYLPGKDFQVGGGGVAVACLSVIKQSGWVGDKRGGWGWEGGGAVVDAR